MSTTTNEYPIIFSPESVRAILDGRKTQTRRVVRFPKGIDDPSLVRLVRVQDGYPDGTRPVWEYPGDDECFSTKPKYGEVGDYLWVQEPFSPRADVDPKEDLEKALQYIEYKANGTILENCWHPYKSWIRPSKMPRWASRITLERTGQRYERLGSLSTRDAFAEGIEINLDECVNAGECTSDETHWGLGAYSSPESSMAGAKGWRECHCVIDRFMKHWDSVIPRKPGLRSEDNPWVEVINFRVIEPAPISR